MWISQNSATATWTTAPLIQTAVAVSLGWLLQFSTLTDELRNHREMCFRTVPEVTAANINCKKNKNNWLYGRIVKRRLKSTRSYCLVWWKYDQLESLIEHWRCNPSCCVLLWNCMAVKGRKAKPNSAQWTSSSIQVSCGTWVFSACMLSVHPWINNILRAEN